MSSIENLDPKASTIFFCDDSISSSTTPLSLACPLIVDNNEQTVKAWTISNFLSQEECKQIIQVTSQSSDFNVCNYNTDISKLLTFDQNDILLGRLQKRLDNDRCFQRMQQHGWIQPYGFFSHLYKWDNDTKRINPCLRISKYNIGGHQDWHRDAQYTCLEQRSNYTLLIYLSSSETGDTVFLDVDESYVQQHNLHRALFSGNTMQKEMQLLHDFKVPTKTYTVKPKAGTAVIFSQRLIHRSRESHVDKWILRTDLVASPTQQLFEKKNAPQRKKSSDMLSTTVSSSAVRRVTIKHFKSIDVIRTMCQLAAISSVYSNQ